MEIDLEVLGKAQSCSLQEMKTEGIQKLIARFRSEESKAKQAPPQGPSCISSSSSSLVSLSPVLFSCDMAVNM